MECKLPTGLFLPYSKGVPAVFEPARSVITGQQCHQKRPRCMAPSHASAAHSKLSANANVSRPFNVSRRTTLQLLRFPHVQEEIEQRLHKKTQDASSI